MIEGIYKKAEDRMKKVVEDIRHEFAGIRTGRATPGLLRDVKAECYGTVMPINQVASISIPEARLIEIRPWDTSTLKDIEKGILQSDLGLTPSTDGKVIRLKIPSLTEERRKDLVRMVRKIAEDHRVSIRNIRRDANDELKSAEKSKEISEDARRREGERIQKLTDQYIKTLDEILGQKEKEIMEV